MEGERANLKAISEAIDSPEAFTAKLLQQLVRNGIIHSVKGIQGGFEIPDKLLSGLRLCDVVKAVDGDGVYTLCAMGLKECSSRNPCPVHNRFKPIRKELKSMLESSRIKEMSKGIHSGKTKLRIQ